MCGCNKTVAGARAAGESAGTAVAATRAAARAVAAQEATGPPSFRVTNGTFDQEFSSLIEARRTARGLTGNVRIIRH